MADDTTPSAQDALDSNAIAYRITDPELHALELAAASELPPMDSFVRTDKANEVLLSVSEVSVQTHGLLGRQHTHVPVVDRPDGRPGYAERMAGGQLLPDGATAPAPRPADPNLDVRELVAADVLNLAGRFRPEEASARVLAGLYSQALTLAVRIRAALEVAQLADDGVPEPPVTGRVRIATVDGVTWLWNGDLREWVPLTPGTTLTDEQRAAVEEHIGPFGPGQEGARAHG